MLSVFLWDNKKLRTIHKVLHRGGASGGIDLPDLHTYYHVPNLVKCLDDVKA